jgi:hypothetical protein
MALYARAILHREQPGPYRDKDALTFARLALVDPDTYAAHRQLADRQLAAVLELPADQIPAVRRDQARVAARTSQLGSGPSQDGAEPAPIRARTDAAGPRSADVAAMDTIQLIQLRGRLVAAVVSGRQAMIAADLAGADRARVQAKALYAIDIATGNRPGPYTDAAAERYADTVDALRADAAPSRTNARRTPAAPGRRRDGRRRR